MGTEPNNPKKNEEAQVGIGTMIVFIATVLVAAVAAGVLIDTSGKLQERSSRTGQEATEKVASNVLVYSIVGKRDTSTATGLDDLNITIGLAPGAKEVDLSQVKVVLQNGTELTTFSYDASATSATEFTATELRDPDSSWSTSSPVLTEGDLIQLNFALDTATLEFAVRDDVKAIIIPEVGTQVVAGFSTPASYGVNTVLVLL